MSTKYTFQYSEVLEKWIISDTDLDATIFSSKDKELTQTKYQLFCALYLLKKLEPSTTIELAAQIKEVLEYKA